MKTFKQFNKEVNEAAALVTALPKIVSVASKLPKIAKFASGALKFGTAIPVGLGIANVLQSKTSNQDKGEEEIKQRKRAEEEEVGKALGKTPGEPLPKIRKRDIIKQEFQKGFKKYKEGLSVKPEDVKGKKYRTPEMKGKSPADYVKELLSRQKENMKAKRKANKEIDDKLGK
tara:strand:+ start:1340 stop:1858 length:519 start_codon:yes stop_codon:yes gene_type:complete